MRRYIQSSAIRQKKRERAVSGEASNRTISAVKNAFREYYFRSKKVEEPSKIELREFGYSQFGQRGMTRHLSFSSMGELTATLVREVPSDVYCSNACYRFPTNPMQEKELIEASLIFDIDGKDLELPCVPSHSYPVCTGCGSAYPPQENKSTFSCVTCGSSKADSVSLPCPKCIEASKKELKKLLSLITHDLGISYDSTSIYFSGNNGFHIHVSDGAFSKLDSSARSDLAGYLSGAGLLPESVGVRRGGSAGLGTVKFPRGGIAYGWRNKMAKKLAIDVTSIIRLQNIVAHAGGYSGFKSELERMARELGARIDSQVTTDVHRIFRMPGTLNSKSGLAKVRCVDIDSFDPFTDSCVIGDSRIAVRLKCPVRFRLRGKSYNISKESAELPAHAAVYLICKGLAEA
jgi:DNA primase small subunit